MSEQNLTMRPQSMNVGMDGWIENVSNFAPLQSDLLVQNIAIACYNAPLSISEISQKLNVAAAYLEAHLDRMVYMDFLKKNGEKYQTNFFIKTNKVQVQEIRYGYENAGIYAEKLYDAVMARKEDFCSVSYFNKEDIREENFLWHMILKIAQELAYEQMELKWKESGLEEPIRKDGSAYWIIANMCEDKFDISEEMKKYNQCRVCNGYQWKENSLGAIYQAETALSIRHGVFLREITEKDKVLPFMNAILSIRDKKDLAEYDKLMIAEFAKDGYIVMKQDAAGQKRPVIHVPVFTENEMRQVQKIIDEIKDTLGRDFLKEYIEGFASAMEPLIPSYLDKNLRNYHKYAVMGGYDLFAHLVKQADEGGKCGLRLPDENEAKYICTLVVLK